MHRPIALLILSALTFSITIAFIVVFFMRNPLEVSFAYPGSGRLISDYETIFFLTYAVSIAQASSFVGAIVTGIGLLKKQRWAWYFALGLHVLILSAHLVALLLLPRYDMNIRITLIAISLPSLYLLSSKDVRLYLISAKNG